MTERNHGNVEYFLRTRGLEERREKVEGRKEVRGRVDGR